MQFRTFFSVLTWIFIITILIPVLIIRSSENASAQLQMTDGKFGITIIVNFMTHPAKAGVTKTDYKSLN